MRRIYTHSPSEGRNDFVNAFEELIMGETLNVYANKRAYECVQGNGVSG